MVTTPRASIPSVTAWMLNSTNSLGTFTNSSMARHTASTGPVPMAAVVAWPPWLSSRVTVAVGRRLVPQLTCTSLSL